MHARYAQQGLTGYGSDESGWAGVRTQGWMQIDSAAPGGPAFIDTTLKLRLTGGVSLRAEAAAFASGSVEIRLFGPGDDARIVEGWSTGVGSGPPVIDSQRLWRTGQDTLVAAVHWPVGQSFNFSLTMYANGAGSGLGAVDLSSEFLLRFDERGAALGLPAGYTAWSPDWGIDDNRFCPSGCAPVPEPATAALSLFGLGLLALLRASAWPRTRAGLEHCTRLCATSFATALCLSSPGQVAAAPTAHAPVIASRVALQNPP